jgi:hypothetical protein
MKKSTVRRRNYTHGRDADVSNCRARTGFRKNPARFVRGCERRGVTNVTHSRSPTNTRYPEEQGATVRAAWKELGPDAGGFVRKGSCRCAVLHSLGESYGLFSSTERHLRVLSRL